MKDKLSMVFCVLGLLVSCNQKGIIKDYTVEMKAKALPLGTILFTQDRNSYFYDLKITDSYYLFMDDKSDTVLRGYQPNEYLNPVFSARRQFGKEGIWRPVLTREVHAGNDGDMVFVVDNDMYLRQLVLSGGDVEINTTTYSKPMIYSADYNLTTKELYASPINRSGMYPYYYFNPDSGYYWVDPSPELQGMLPKNEEFYINSLCVNEVKDAVVTAYRFTNHVSFYDLKGDLSITVRLGEEVIQPVERTDAGELNIERATKCFTSIYGTPEYVYCVYDGSSDFCAQSKIVVFTWDGCHRATYEADRNICALAVDKDNTFILAISSTPDRGQDILKYSLVAK